MMDRETVTQNEHGIPFLRSLTKPHAGTAGERPIDVVLAGFLGFVVMLVISGFSTPATATGRGGAYTHDALVMRLDRQRQMIELLRQQLCRLDDKVGLADCHGVITGRPVSAVARPHGQPLSGFIVRSISGDTAWISRSGVALGDSLTPVRAGSVIPGLGRAEGIVRIQGGWVVQMESGYLPFSIGDIGGDDSDAS